MKCDELKAYKQGSVELGEYWVYDAEDVDAVIAELKDENRKLKRALWLARAKRAFAEYFFWNHIAFDKKYAKNKFTISHSNTTNNKSKKVSRTPREWSDIWYDVEFKCNAYADKLAKEYK